MPADLSWNDALGVYETPDGKPPKEGTINNPEYTKLVNDIERFIKNEYNDGLKLDPLDRHTLVERLAGHLMKNVLSPDPYAHAVRHLDEAEDDMQYLDTPSAAKLNALLGIGWALLAIARKR